MNKILREYVRLLTELHLNDVGKALFGKDDDDEELGSRRRRRYGLEQPEKTSRLPGEFEYIPRSETGRMALEIATRWFNELGYDDISEIEKNQVIRHIAHRVRMLLKKHKNDQNAILKDLSGSLDDRFSHLRRNIQ